MGVGLSRRAFLKIGTGTALGWALEAGTRGTAQGTQTGLTEQRRRARDLGIRIGHYEPGPYNAITDVAGVRVGHSTLIRGQGPLVVGQGPVRTGITAILPHPGNLYQEPLLAGYTILNGNGEMTGLAPIAARGTLETPVFLTGTDNVGLVYDAAVTYLLQQNPTMGLADPPAYPVVAECYDAGLNDARGRHVRESHVLTAIARASSGPVEEGAVGGGTGMTCYGFKGGIGTASRRLDRDEGGYTVAALVMANHGRRHQLVIDGVPVGREIRDLMPFRQSSGQNSIIIIIATDAPLSPRQLTRLARRGELGLARTGAVSMHSSGDLLLAFSTATRLSRKQGVLQTVPVLANSNRTLTPLYEGVVEATEEAIINALTMARTLVGRDGNTSYGIPLERLQAIMDRYGRLFRE